MKKLMTKKEAADLQSAYLSGYVEPDNSELIEAGNITGKRAIVKKFNSTANPLATTTIRTLAGGKRE